MEKFLNPCPDPNPLPKSNNLDDPAIHCEDCTEKPTQKDVAFLEDLMKDKTGIGIWGNCDPMTTGQIVQDFTKEPNRNVIYRYSRGIRGCDEAMRDMFSNLVVLDEQAVAHPVPIIWATQERAVAAVLQENVRKDTSLVVDRLKLPMMSIYSNNFNPNYSRFTHHRATNWFRDSDGKPSLHTKEKYERDTVFGYARGIPLDIDYLLTIWTYFIEDMNQILEQILLKFSTLAILKIQGVHWETVVKLNSIANNIDLEPGNSSRVIKFQIGMTAETYIPQPIRREKSVLKTSIEISDGLRDEDITRIIKKLEQTVKELEQ